jgi:urease accessory protein
VNPLLSLLQLSDPALPIGAYAHSAGLETYVQAGIVRDPVTAGDFVREMLATSIRYTDAALLALSHEATLQKDWQRLTVLDQLCEAVKIPKEIRLASSKLGTRLLKIVRGFGHAVPAGPPVPLRHYPVIFGYASAILDIPLAETLTGYYYNAAAGMVTNCVKLIPIGQQDGQELLFSLQPLIGELVAAGLQPDEGLIGLCCTGFDIRCMQHEQLYSRLYMS